MYYTPTLLRLAGVTSNRSALLLSMGPAAVNAGGTVAGMLLIDRVGRRWEPANGTCCLYRQVVSIYSLRGSTKCSRLYFANLGCIGGLCGKALQARSSRKMLLEINFIPPLNVSTVLRC